MIKQSGESIDYLLLHCEVARELFVSIFHCFGFEWVVSQQEVEMSACWENPLGSSRNIEVWRMVPVESFESLSDGPNDMKKKAHITGPTVQTHRNTIHSLPQDCIAPK